MCTGRPGAADFLVIEYLGSAKARLAFDHWGSGGPTSDPFPIEPGRTQRLEILLPALQASPAQREALVRVRIDGELRFEGRVRSHGRQPAEIFIGLNPAGGTSSGPEFKGTLRWADGRVVQGGPEAIFGRRLLALKLVRSHPSAVGSALLAGALASIGAWLVLRWVGKMNRRPRVERHWQGNTRAPHGTFLAMLVICGLVFTWHITQGTFQLIYPDSFGSFYDQQAASLLQGGLDVPESAISGEAFVVNGKFYGYFGITPALLRLPLAAFNGLTGQVSRLYMLGFYLLGLAAAYAVLCQGTRLVTGAKVWPSRWSVALLMGSAGLGSTLLFLGSRAYVYHEAILAGAAFALITVVALIRWWLTGHRRWAGLALLAGLVALHARPTPGLFALGLVGAAALGRTWLARHSPGWREPLLWAVGAGCALLTFSGMSYLKFGTFDGSPFRYAVQYTPERRARFEDRNFHLGNLGHNADVYVFSADLAVNTRFPFFHFAGDGPGGIYPRLRIDLEEPAVSLPVTMPALFLLATAAGLWAALAAPGLRAPLVLLAIAVAPMALALLTAIVTSHRYTGDFCPWLIASAALGLAAIDANPSRWRPWLLGVITALTLWATAVNSGLALKFRGEMVWGIPDAGKQHYLELRDRVDRLLGVRRS
jgi:hypothetical protein